MKRYVILITTLLATATCFASLDNQVTWEEESNGYATVAGHVTGAPPAKVRVTLENGGLSYSTIPDENGDWAIVFRYFSMSYRLKTSDGTGAKRMESRKAH